MHRYEKKLKQFDKNPKKIYCVDNGIVTKSTPRLNEKQGALLETLIAVQLKRLGKEFYYYKGKTGAECDFVLPHGKQAIQVCLELHDTDKDREIKGLLEALTMLHTKQGVIVTLDQEDYITIKDKTLVVKPAWQWLLENEPVI